MDKSISLQQIGTPRLTIRPMSEEDIPSIFGLMSDFETAARAGFKPLGSSSEAEGFLHESIRRGDAYGLTLKDRPYDVFGILTLLPHEKRTVKRQDQTVTESNENRVCNEFGCWIQRETIPSALPSLMMDQSVRGGLILSDPDAFGFFTMRGTYSDEDELCCVVGDHGTPSLYRGRLDL